MGKTREQTQEIDPYLAGKARANADKAERASLIPFLPNMGGTVAGFTPTQLDAFKMGDSAASAFGFTPSGYTPPAGEMKNGIMTHSPGDWYQEMKDESIPQPMQDYIDSFFIDPTTGKRPGGGGGGKPIDPQAAIQLAFGDGPSGGAHGDGNSSYGGGSGWSTNPYDDPISGGNSQYGTERSLANRGVSAVGNTLDRATGGGSDTGGK